MADNFCVIVGQDLVVPKELIKPNGLGVNYDFIDFLRFQYPGKLGATKAEVNFNYPINRTCTQDNRSEKVELLPNGPCQLAVTKDCLLNEIRWVATNNQHHFQFSIVPDLIYTRSANWDMEQALKAASFFTKDPVKIASLACAATSLNISALTKIKLIPLCDKLATASDLFERFLALQNKVIPKKKEKITFAEFLSFLRQLFEPLFVDYYPSTDLETESTQITY